jgi:hypothetical protein
MATAQCTLTYLLHSCLYVTSIDDLRLNPLGRIPR